METVKLTPDFAERVYEIELAVYPPQFISGIAMIRDNLMKAERDRENLSWGIMDDNKLVAYLISWVDASAVEGREFEEVVFIDDIGVLPGHQTALFKLLTALKEDIDRHGLRWLPIEGAARIPSFKVFSRHEQVFQDLGYSLVSSYEYWDEGLSENMVWVRFEPQDMGLKQQEKCQEVDSSVITGEDSKDTN